MDLERVLGFFPPSSSECKRPIAPRARCCGGRTRGGGASLFELGSLLISTFVCVSCADPGSQLRLRGGPRLRLRPRCSLVAVSCSSAFGLEGPFTSASLSSVGISWFCLRSVEALSAASRSVSSTVEWRVCLGGMASACPYRSAALSRNPCTHEHRASDSKQSPRRPATYLLMVMLRQTRTAISHPAYGGAYGVLDLHVFLSYVN